MDHENSRAHPLLPWPAPQEPRAGRDAPALAAYLTARVTRRVAVVFGRSRTLPVQLRRRGSDFLLRLHGFFTAAPDDVLDALAMWVAQGRRGRGACQHLDRWLDGQLARLPVRTKAPAVLRTRGAAYDLAAMANELRAAPGLHDLAELPALTWGRERPLRRRRRSSSLQLGLFDPETNTVRMHPVLDDASVPEWFVRSVLFHELLHAAVPPRRDAQGRWIKHGPEFRRRERAYPDYSRACTWLDANITRLLRAARRRR
jgi:hypothetical protein